MHTFNICIKEAVKDIKGKVLFRVKIQTKKYQHLLRFADNVLLAKKRVIFKTLPCAYYIVYRIYSIYKLGYIELNGYTSKR